MEPIGALKTPAEASQEKSQNICSSEKNLQYCFFCLFFAHEEVLRSICKMTMYALKIKCFCEPSFAYLCQFLNTCLDSWKDVGLNERNTSKHLIL